MAPQKAAKAKRTNNRYVIDLSAPAGDKILDVAAFEKFLHDRIKVQGLTGNLGDSVTIAREDDKIVVTTKIDFSKRYLKYLTKKFLKKNMLRDWLRVVAGGKDTYVLKYFNVSNEAGADAEGSDDDEDDE
ncbi:60S ribosomal protein L22 [Coemansia javaensis]|uniref:60S ribosomal protein L22 n=1 Tax=Coemansia javaensis TaxID=2761396 RepID=A0A9W8H8Y9_9FUNG|nr:60S ribosomal protein L22 [Coemansia javaensis]